MNRKSLAKVVATHMFMAATLTGMRMSAPLQALSHGYSAAAVGFLMALFAVTQVFLSLPAGRYTDRHGLHRPLLVCALTAGAGTLLASAFPIFPVLCVCAMLVGGATGTAAISLQRHVGRMAESAGELKLIFSWLSIGPAISNFVGPLVAGVVIDHFGYRWAFATLACFPLIAWACVRKAPELPPKVHADGAKSATAWQMLRQPTFRRLLIANWFISSCWDVHNLAVPIIGHERGFSASVIGSILATYAVASTIVRVTIPMIASRLKEWKVLICAMTLVALAFGAYPLQHTAIGMGICSFVVGFALGMVNPMIMSMLHQITPENRQGEALGLRMMFINASSVAVPALFGAVGAAIGISAVLWVTGLSVLSGTRVAWQLRDSNRQMPR